MNKSSRGVVSHLELAPLAPTHSPHSPHPTHSPHSPHSHHLPHSHHSPHSPHAIVQLPPLALPAWPPSRACSPNGFHLKCISVKSSIIRAKCRHELTPVNWKNQSKMKELVPASGMFQRLLADCNMQHKHEKKFDKLEESCLYCIVLRAL